MAKTEIEERAWSDPRLGKLAKALGVRRVYAMGLLAKLWHDSQEEEVNRATADDLESWLELSPDESDGVRRALVGAGYATSIDEHVFRIKGNALRIKKVRASKARASTASEARWSKYRKCKKPSDNGNKEAMLGAMHKHPGKTMHMQSRYGDREIGRYGDSSSDPSDRTTLAAASASPSVQAAPIFEAPKSDDGPKTVTIHVSAADLNVAPPKSNGKVPPSRRKPPTHAELPLGIADASTASPGVSDAIGAYVTAYESKYGKRPPLHGAQRGTIKRLVADVGADRAIALIKGFVEMNDAYFSNRTHCVTVLPKDIAKVELFLARGVQMTARTAQRIETATNNMAVAERFKARARERVAAAESGGADVVVDCPF